jgi:hypothetical protein
MSKIGSKEQDAEQFLHEAHQSSDLSFWMRNPLEGFNGSSSTGSISVAAA